MTPEHEEGSRLSWWKFSLSEELLWRFLSKLSVVAAVVVAVVVVCVDPPFVAAAAFVSPVAVVDEVALLPPAFEVVDHAAGRHRSLARWLRRCRRFRFRRT